MRRRIGGLPPRQFVGLIMFSAGCGMLIVIVIPWWGFFAALALVAVGGWLLFTDCC